jgi:hypothetical protein
MQVDTIKFSEAEIEFLENRKSVLVAQKKQIVNYKDSFEVVKCIMKIDDWIIEDLKNKTFTRYDYEK